METKPTKRNTEKITLTDRQQRWLVAHFKHTKNDEIMAKLGLSHSTLHRFARELGLKKTRQFMAKMQANASAAGAEAIANETPEQKERRRQQANQNRNPDRSFKAGRYALENKTAKERAAINEKRRKSWLKTRKEDEMRLNWGLPLQTKFRFARHTDPKKNRRLMCIRNYFKTRGYIFTQRSGMIAYYTAETKRSAKVEAEATKLGMLIREYKIIN